MQFKPLVLLAACYVLVSVNVDAKNVGSVPGKSPEQGMVMLNDDLSNLDFSQFKAARFEFEKKDEQINMRVPVRAFPE